RLRELLEERAVLVAQVRDDLRGRDPAALDGRVRLDLRLHGPRVVLREDPQLPRLRDVRGDVPGLRVHEREDEMVWDVPEFRGVLDDERLALLRQREFDRLARMLCEILARLLPVDLGDRSLGLLLVEPG